MADTYTIGTAASPTALNSRTNYRVIGDGGRRRIPRSRSFATYRNAYGAELATSQGGPEQINLRIVCVGTGVQAALTASDALDTALSAARDYHFTNPDDRDTADAILFKRQIGNQTTVMIWDVIDGDWDIEREALGGPYQIEGNLTLYLNRVS